MEVGVSLEAGFLVVLPVMNTFEAKVRKVLLEEIEELREIGRRTFTDSFGHQNTKADFNKYMEDNFSHEKIAAEFLNPESHFFFVESSKKIAGYLKLNEGNAQTDDSLGDAMEVERIYVDSLYQGKGIGQVLFDKAIAVARMGNFSRIWLGVWERNTGAIRFYERNGLVKFGTHTFRLGDDDQTDILMKLEL